MSTNLLQILPTEGFNDKFTEIINGEITNPPYNQNFFDKFFFIKKRLGTELLKAKTGEVFEDIIEYTDINKTEVLVSATTSTKVIVYKLDLNTLNLTELLNQNKGNNARMFKVLSGGESVLTSGTATSGTVNTLVKTSAGWTVNAFAGAYIYLASGTGAGALCNILSNTSDTITVANAGGGDPFDVAPASGTTFYVYESLVDNIVIQVEDAYWKYDGNSFLQIITTQGNKMADATMWKSIFWFADNKGNVYYSDERDVFKFYEGSTATPRILRTGENGILRIYPFGDVMIIATSNKMYIVKASLNSTTGLYVYSTQEITSSLGLFSSGAIHYDKGMYLVGSDKRFYSLSLTVTGNQYVANLEEQGQTIFNYLNRLEFGVDKLNIYSDSQNIYIYDTTGDTEEYVYNVRYKGWTKNEYAMNVSGKKILNNRFYILGDGYIGFKSEGSYYKDLGEDYFQKIESVFGVDNIFNMKMRKYFNVLLGKADYTQDGILKAERQIANKKYSYEWDLFDSEYLTNIYDALQDTMGSSIMGIELMGGDNTSILEAISDIEIIKTPVDIAGYICKMTITSEGGSGIMFGGRQGYENVLNNNTKTYTNVIG